jgi:predicted nuclease with TOPRIM domain
MANSEVGDYSDNEVLEYADKQSEYDDLENELYEKRNELDYLDDEEDEDEYSELENRIDEIESEMENVIEEAKEEVYDRAFDRWYDCLESDPIDCLVNTHGMYSDVHDMVDAGVLYVREDDLISDLASGADYDVLGEYEEVEDYDGETWFVFEL